MVLQPAVRAGAALSQAGSGLKVLPEQADTLLDVFEMVSVRVFSVFSGHVREYAVPDLAGSIGRFFTAGGDQAVLDL